MSVEDSCYTSRMPSSFTSYYIPCQVCTSNIRPPSTACNIHRHQARQHRSDRFQRDKRDFITVYLIDTPFKQIPCFQHYRYQLKVLLVNNITSCGVSPSPQPGSDIPPPVPRPSRPLRVLPHPSPHELRPPTADSSLPTRAPTIDGTTDGGCWVGGDDGVWRRARGGLGGAVR